MTEALLNVLAKTIARPVGENERKRARLHLLDWLACVAGGRDSEAGHLGGLISRQGWERASYVGGALGIGDIHRAASVNPGAVIWPAAMSMGSAVMEARLDAAVRGYEAMIAVGCACDAHHHDHWDAAATSGVFGAAAAFGSLIGFAEIEYANALGNAGSVAGGVLHMQHDNVLTRHWHTYHAVRTGRDAALHVHYGATGPAGVLEGPQGVFAAMTNAPGDLRNAGSGWLIGEVGFQVDSSPNGEGVLGEPSKDEIIAKMRALGGQSGLSEDISARAAELALQSDDAAAIDTLLEEWLA